MIIELANNCSVKIPNEIVLKKTMLLKLLNFTVKKVKLNNSRLNIYFYYDKRCDSSASCSRVWNRSNTFNIFINVGKIENDNQLTRLFLHELTHAQQMVDGLLSPKRDFQGMTWLGVYYSRSIFRRLSVADYEKLPWEVPAYAIEKTTIPTKISKSKILTFIVDLFVSGDIPKTQLTLTPDP
jgi:hypothetical protein